MSPFCTTLFVTLVDLPSLVDASSVLLSGVVFLVLLQLFVTRYYTMMHAADGVGAGYLWNDPAFYKYSNWF